MFIDIIVFLVDFETKNSLILYRRTDFRFKIFYFYFFLLLWICNMSITYSVGEEYQFLFDMLYIAPCQTIIQQENGKLRNKKRITDDIIKISSPLGISHVYSKHKVYFCWLKNVIIDYIVSHFLSSQFLAVYPFYIFLHRKGNSEGKNEESKSSKFQKMGKCKIQ